MGSATIYSGLSAGQMSESLLLVGTKTSTIETGLPLSNFRRLVGEFQFQPTPEDRVINLFFGTPAKPTFYTGLLPEVLGILKNQGIVPRVLDRRRPISIPKDVVEQRLSEIDTALQAWKGPGKVLRDFQREVPYRALKNPCCAFEIATGGGKTAAISALLHVMQQPSLVLVDGIDLMDQLAEQIGYLVGHDKVGRLGAGTDTRNFYTVGIIDTVVRHRDFLKQVKVLVTDEAHLAGSQQFREAIHYCDAEWRWGFSGTYIRMPAEMHLLYAATGAREMRITASDLIRMGWIARPEITLVQMPASTEYRGGIQQEILIREFIVRNQPRNRVACNWAADRIREGHKLFMFVVRLEHGRIIKDMLTAEFGVPAEDVVFVHGKSGDEKRKRALRDLESGAIRCVICTEIFGKGIDVPSVSAGVNLKGLWGEVNCRQTIGRILRLDESKNGTCLYLDFVDESPEALRAYAYNRQRIYESEPEFLKRTKRPEEVWSGFQTRQSGAPQKRFGGKASPLWN